MITIFAYKKNEFLKFLSNIPFFKITTWQKNNNKKMNQIDLPDSSLYFDNRNIASNYVKNIIEKEKIKSKNLKLNIIYDYIGKVLMLNLDFIIFKKNFKYANQNFIIENSLIKNIYYNKKEKFFHIKLFFYFIKFLAFVLRSFFFTIKKNKISHPDILFLRKKEYYDLGLYGNFKNSFNNKNIKVNGSIFTFSYKNKFDNFSYLGSFNKSSTILIKSFFSVILLLPIIIFKINKKTINSKIAFNLFVDLLLCKYVTSLNTKILTGVLVDKPIFSLLPLFKKERQLSCSLNEFFHFDPYQGFDYCNLDVYYSLNDMDFLTHNKSGGIIKDNINTPFIRNNLKTNSNGISVNLKKINKKYNKKILILTSQIPKIHYFNQEEDLIFFIKNILDLSSKFPEYLFIVKEKKDELNYLNNKLINRLSNTNNIFLIRSKIPRKLKYDQFEDLLLISDLIISSVFVSTTIWQGLSNNVPSISFSRYLHKSFMDNYKYLNVEKKEIFNAINYWIDISKEDFEKFLLEIKNKTNISKENGFELVTNNMEKLLNKL